MPFMEPQICFGTWFEIDGPEGTEFVDASLIDSPEEYLAQCEAESPEVTSGYRYDSVPEPLATYTENRKASHIRLITGWGARLSAPGYLDCTPWSVFKTQKEAQDYLDEQTEE